MRNLPLVASGGGGLHTLVPRLSWRWLGEAADERWTTAVGTLVSADLSGFTALSERLAAKGRVGAEEVTATVNRCFTALIEGAEHDGGDVLKFGGDALLLWFAGEDHSPRAVRAAARMQAAIAGPALRSAGLKMSVGVASGELVAFLVGSPQRELLVAGPVASRTVVLESAAEAGEVLVDAWVADTLPSHWIASRDEAKAAIDLDKVETAAPGVGVDVPAADIDLVPLIPARVAAHVGAVAAAGGEHRLASIAFIGIDDLDDRIAEHGPAVVADQLETLLTEVQGTTAGYGVSCLASDVMTGGIKLILAAGVPVTTGEDEEAMLRAVRDIADRVWDGHTRIGVHRGAVFAGFLGSPTRRTYTIMGDPVNLSARLMGKAARGEVVASDELTQRCLSQYQLRSLEPFLVKGKTAPIIAHAVEARREERTQDRSRRHPLVGREVEVARLREAIARAVAGEGTVIELVADAGVGKTRLVQELVADRRVLAHYGVDCQPYDILSAYASVRPLLRTIAGIGGDTAAAAAGAELLAWLAAVAPDLVPFAPLLAVPFGADVDPTPEADAVADRVRQRRTEEVTVQALGAALKQPTLLVVEDTYYVDEASRLLLHALARVVTDHAWLLCITRRPETPGVVGEEIPGEVLELSPLGRTDAADLVDTALAGLALSDDSLHRLLERAGGNPLFVLSLVEALRDGTGDAQDLPETIERLVAVRIDSLPPLDLTLLRHAAVVGRTFAVDLVEVATAAVGVRDAGDLARWRSMDEFLEPTGPRAFSFRHALFREAAYAGLPFKHREHVHGAIADHLVATPTVAAPTGLIATHFSFADRPAEAFEWSVRAGDEALQDHTVVEAAAAYSRALEVARRARAPRGEVARVLESRGNALFRAGEYEIAGDSFAKARKLVTEPPASVARLLRRSGEVRERLGNLRGAARWFGRAVKALPATTDDPDERREHIELELAFGGIRYRVGRTREANEHIDRALAEAETSGEDRAIARACYMSVGLTGNPDEDERRAKVGLATFERLGDPWGQAQVLNNLGVDTYFAGRWTESAEYYARARELFTQAGDSVAAAMAANNLAEILIDQGRFAAAERDLRQALRVWRAAGYQVGEALATMNLGRVAAKQLDLEAAASLLADAEERFARMALPPNLLECRARQGEVALQSGRLEDAETIATAVLGADAGDELEPHVVARCQRLLGWVALQRSELDEAHRRMGEAVATAEATDQRYELAQSLAALTLVARRRGDAHVEAFEAESERLFEQLDVRVRPWAPTPTQA